MTYVDRHIRLVVLIAIFIELIVFCEADRANPLKDPHICGRPECEEYGQKFKYESNIIYRYEYAMHIKTEFSGSGENSSDIFLTSVVELTFPRRCEGILKIQSVEIRERTTATQPEETENEYDYVEEAEEIELHPKNDGMAEDIIKHDLRFAFHDGLIGEICPNEAESTWSMNFKKGILSAFQNTMQRFDIDYNTTETDVSGTCDVAYALNGVVETSLLIQKTKDIQSCKNRYQMHSVLQTTSYDFRRNYAAWPILQSDSYCNISIDHFVYNQVICYERHQLVPFSNNKNGAVSESKISLKLIDEETTSENFFGDDDDVPPITTRATLLFNHKPTGRPTHNEIKASRDFLKQMCQLGFPDIQRDFPDVFTKFLSTSRLLSYAALQQLLARASSICGNGKNHVLESLPYIGSTASVLLMRDQIVKNAISTEIAHDWMASLSFLPRPDENIVEAMYNLIEFGKTKNDPVYILGASAVVHTFCRHNAECEANTAVIKVVEYLEEDIMKNLENEKFDRKTRERLMITLKGLGNIGVVTDEFEDTLRSIIENDEIPMEIRLQTVYAYRRLDCHQTREYFLDLYGNFTMQSEIRIAAYLQTMKCPDYQSVNYIRNILKIEEVNQVGSYVWSHLHNLAKSASPVRVEAQGLLVDTDLETKFKMDVRKFSRNYEQSIFFDEYNFGANTDGNLIFSTDSYLPRAASLNFTADLFGESVNFLEISARMQGFESFIESIFGPKGPLNAEKFKEKLSLVTGLFKDNAISIEDDDFNFDRLNMKVKRESENAEDYDYENDHVHRKSREIDPKTELEKNIKDTGYNLKYNFNEPKASFGMKVFGNDLKYFTVEGFPEVAEAASKLNPINYITDLLSGKEITYSKSGVFLDASYSVPLSSGIPLSITALGASSIDLRMSGSLRGNDFLKTKHVDIEGKIKPSVSVDLITSIQADFFLATSGIRVKSNLYSSSSIEAKLKVRGTKLISLQFSLPQDRSDIFSARSELLVVKFDKDIPQKGIQSRYENSTCTWPFIDTAIGLKICSEYSLPDVSNLTDVPSLILSGPINIDVHCDKADLTAKTYLFEFRWDTNKDDSVGSLIFQTPGSVIPRIFSANITRSPTGHNMTMFFRNGDTEHTAVSTYRNTAEDKRLKIHLDINGERSLALELGYNRSDLKNGYMFYPLFLLSVNNENIAGLSGTVKFTNKKDVLQWDMNVVFETKRLQTKMAGYFIQTAASHTTKFSLEYQFLDSNVETIEFEGELANRSQKGRTDIQGSTKLKSSAYPKFNFASKMRFLSAMGHVEWKIDYNNAPDLVDPRYNLGVRIVFARSKQLETGKTVFFIEANRPRSNTNLKYMIKYDERAKNGAEHNLLILIRYATKKEITSVLSVLFPRRSMFAVDALLNITVPAFDSCTVGLKLIEKSPKEYNIDFKGTWFSKHSITIKGTYQDRSSTIKTYHHIKLNVQSPSFEETTIDARYSRDEYELIMDCQAEYAKQPYGFNLKYSEQSIYQTLTYAEIKWKERLYWLSADMKSQQPKQLVVEIHIDKFRDIHLILRGLSNEFKKEAGIEIKWDANRDPTQKLAISAEFNAPRRKTYDGRFLFTYPERTFSGTFDMYTGGPEYKGNARLGWSSSEAVVIHYVSGNRPGIARDMFISMKIKTPFDGWRENSIDGGLFYLNNLLLVNGSVIWAENQNLGIEFLGDYEIKDPIFRCEIKTALNSSILDVPTVSAHFKHQHDEKRFDTDATIKYTSYLESTQTFSIRSGWQFDIDESYHNISGSIALRSPFEGYTTGALVTKFSFSDKRQLKGAADLDLEEKKYTLAVEGHLKKLTENMLVMNITTPIEKFRNIVGRFGINDKEKHLVAEVRAPTGALGIEILFSVISSTNFDIKFHLATPLEAFEKVMLIGLMKPDQVDFRGGWNKVVLGFVGVWRLNDLRDFEYSYKVYSPLENFENNGIVIRFVYKEQFDLELSIKLAQYKVGIKLLAEPKPKIMKQLRLQNTHEVISKLFSGENLMEEDDGIADNDDYDDEDDADIEDNSLSFSGIMELDTIIWPTLKGNMDFDEVDNTYYCFATLILPNGIVEIRDRFFFPNFLIMKNTLRIDTPFSIAKEIKSNYEMTINFGKMYIVGVDVNFSDGTEWIETGVRVNYTRTTDSHEVKTHDCQLNIKTPLRLMPYLDLQFIVELEDNQYRANLTGKTKTTDVSLFGALESDDNYMDTSLGLSLSAPLVSSYSYKVYFKKDFSDIENVIDVGFDILDDGVFNNFQMEATWHTDKPHYISAKGKIQTTLLPLKLVGGSILITRTPNPLATFEIGYTDQQNESVEFRVRASRKREAVNLEINSPLEGFRNISLHGTLSPQSTQGNYNVLGNMYRNNDIFHVEGTMSLINDVPVHINLLLKPLAGGQNGVLVYSINNAEGNIGKTFQARIARNDIFLQVGGGLSFQSKFNWGYAITVLSSEPEIGRISLNMTVAPDASGRLNGLVEASSPWKHFGLESVKLESNALVTADSGDIYGSYELASVKGEGKASWSWILMENMQFSIDSESQRTGFSPRILKTGLHYVNPKSNLQNLNVGGVLNLDDVWRLEINGSAMLVSKSNISLIGAVRLPNPVGDVHRFNLNYRDNLGTKGNTMEINYDAKYETDEAKIKLASRGHYKNANDLEGLFRFEWGPHEKNKAVEADMQMRRKGGERKEFSARILTPFHQEDTLLAGGSYDYKDIYHMLAGQLSIPASKQVAEADVSYSSLSNTKGMVNCSTPFLNITWFRGDFDFATTGGQSKRFLKTTWPSNTALFDSKSSFTSNNNNRDLQGTIKIEVPLATRHYADIVYGIKERPLLTTGNAVVEYNKKKILNGNYNLKSESRAGYEKSVIDIALENEMKPVGIHYVHIRESAGPGDPDFDFKRAELFELRNSAIYNITGEFHVRTSVTGQEYKIFAIHPNRTVILTSDYDYQDDTTKQKSRLELAPTVWIGYDWKSQNLTKADNESQTFSLEISYPHRSLSASGWYSVTENVFDSDVSLQWNKDDEDELEEKETKPKVMRAAIQWRNEPLTGNDKENQTCSFSLGHPSFEKDVKFQGFYYRSDVDLFKAKLIVDYCNEPDHLLTLGTTLQDLTSVVGYRNYSYEIYGYHEISELDLDVRGTIAGRPGLYETLSNGRYKRGYLPLQEGNLLGTIDLKNKEIHYHKTSPYKVTRYWGRADGLYPIYTINGTVEDSPDTNASATFYVDIDDKFIRLEVNLTPDASQNLQLIGSVPDARSASFDVWRDYEDIRVVDVASYLRMNHSRLITSKVIWRPKMRSEFKQYVRAVAASYYESLSEGIDYWVKTLYSETTDTVNDIWQNAKPYTQIFLDDVSGLRVLEEDLGKFRNFLNESYEANDFYVRSVVNFTITIIDELAIRDHIETVPKILNEIWQVMGESGQALRKSILWLIETVKTSYKKAVEMITKILHGESLEHVSTILEKAVERYDKFIKDLHLSLIKYVENMWTKLTDMITSYWKKLLQNIEPSIIKFAHYLETVMWNISKELFDFLYKRTNELVESPYFNKVSNFTQDLDRLYKDFVNNNAITNFKKYSVQIWKFVKEKYFKLVPFGKELHDVMMELYDEIKTLQDREAIQFVIQRLQEVQTKMEWIADELQLEKRIQQLWGLLKNKLMSFAQTALQTDNRYREAKTKFIFDPDTGVIELEQKLPMSWHSFNETPIFEEIPEYKLIGDVQKFFMGSNFSIWSLYYETKPYLDPNTWLPPFKSQSLLIGSRHFMTFDKKFVALNVRYSIIEPDKKPDQCSYLLSSDWFTKNFTLAFEPSIISDRNDLISTRKLSLIADDELLSIDVVSQAVRIGRNSASLPAQISDLIIYRDADVVYIESAQGFSLFCNLQFDICTFELSGWYFGKTAGLLGTMNNEMFDDFTTSHNSLNQDNNEFVSSWALAGCPQSAKYEKPVDVSPEVVKICDSFFKSKISYFSTCFPVIDTAPFYEMCLDLGQNSMSNAIMDDHPSNKGTCAASLAYIEACNMEKTPLRVPENCVHCNLINGSYVPEGTFISIEDGHVPKTTDVVFIIEAKPCNENVTITKSLMSVVSALNQEFQESNITNNRYAVIVFGGESPFDKPRSVVVNNEVFTDSKNLGLFFDHIKAGNNSNKDIFQAISVASKLIFRPGASKTFILLPCSECMSTDMKLDYSSLLQLLLENGINLHILMDHELVFDKARASRLFFGMDRAHAYTKKDVTELKGDSELRKQVRLPKSTLGLCTPLAIETNGTIFTAKKLKPDRRNPIKKFSTVFAKRVALTAAPSDCQTCECTGHNTGVSYMICFPCSYPGPGSMDYEGFNEDHMLSVMQSGADFEWWEEDDEIF